MDCVVTSPPYWQLRDYGVKGQIGLEATFQEYIQKICDVFDQVKRVLKPTGTCWVNLGDTYASQGMHNKDFNERWHGKKFKSLKQAQTDEERPLRPQTSVPEKSLVLIPFRFAIEMLNRGWRLRNVIVWHKPNCMPCSSRDRFTIDFEYFFFFAQSPRYYFEQQFEPAVDPKTRQNGQLWRNKRSVWKISSEIGRRSILAGTSTRIQGRRLPSRFCRALPAGDCIPWDETSAASGEFRLRRTRRRTLPRFPKNSAKLLFSPALLILCAGSAGRDGSLCSSQRRCMRAGFARSGNGESTAWIGVPGKIQEKMRLRCAMRPHGTSTEAIVPALAMPAGGLELCWTRSSARELLASLRNG